MRRNKIILQKWRNMSQSVYLESWQRPSLVAQATSISYLILMYYLTLYLLPGSARARIRLLLAIWQKPPNVIVVMMSNMALLISCISAAMASNANETV